MGNSIKSKEEIEAGATTIEGPTEEEMVGKGKTSEERVDMARVSGWGFRFRGLRFRIWGLGFRLKELTVWDFGFRA